MDDPKDDPMDDSGHPSVKHPLRILQIETFGRGGLTHYAYNLSLALAERGHHITFVTAANYELEGRSDLPPNVEVVKAIGRIHHRLGASMPGLVRNLWLKIEAIYDSFAVARLARRLRPDVVHLHCTNQIALLYLRALRRLGRPLVATAHVVTPHEPIRFQDAVYRRVHQLGDLIIAHSEFDQQRLLDEFDVDSRRVRVIPHGEYGFFDHPTDGDDEPDDVSIERIAAERITVRKSLGLGPQDEVALFFGYIREYKGLDVLFEAWPQVTPFRSAARLLVAGDPVQLGPERRQELERWATRLGAVHRFGYIPFSDVSRYFAAADVLVMPYRHISQSGVLFLALSLGLPVVATKVGALPEMLDDGDSALLVSPESPDDLARALVRVLGDADLRERLAQGGREVAEAHSWSSIAEQTEAAFAELVDNVQERS